MRCALSLCPPTIWCSFLVPDYCGARRAAGHSWRSIAAQVCTACARRSCLPTACCDARDSSLDSPAAAGSLSKPICVASTHTYCALMVFASPSPRCLARLSVIRRHWPATESTPRALHLDMARCYSTPLLPPTVRARVERRTGRFKKGATVDITHSLVAVAVDTFEREEVSAARDVPHAHPRAPRHPLTWAGPPWWIRVLRGSWGGGSARCSSRRSKQRRPRPPTGRRRACPWCTCGVGKLRQRAVASLASRTHARSVHPPSTSPRYAAHTPGAVTPNDEPSCRSARETSCPPTGLDSGTPRTWARVGEVAGARCAHPDAPCRQSLDPRAASFAFGRSGGSRPTDVARVLGGGSREDGRAVLADTRLARRARAGGVAVRWAWPAFSGREGGWKARGRCWWRWLCGCGCQPWSAARIRIRGEERRWGAEIKYLVPLSETDLSPASPPPLCRVQSRLRGEVQGEVDGEVDGEADREGGEEEGLREEERVRTFTLLMSSASLSRTFSPFLGMLLAARLPYSAFLLLPLTFHVHWRGTSPVPHLPVVRRPAVYRLALPALLPHFPPPSHFAISVRSRADSLLPAPFLSCESA
ncbi:hypothetical protein DFH06DRAFT_577794 [Mycena polygramma]|nr:hypothetical protein DFH06DRAFT_577794 [Mycena polygramma]